MKIITSVANKEIKQINSLKSAKNRKKEGLGLIESIKVLNEAINAGEIIKAVYIEEGKTEKFKHLQIEENKVCLVAKHVMQKISSTKTPQGIVAVFEVKNKPFKKPKGNFMVLDNIQDPLNLGAILRTAAATGFNDVYLLNCVNPYNVKALRASMGTVFKLNVFETALENLALLKENASLFSADMDGESIFEVNNLQGVNVGVIIGNEGNGVSAEVLKIINKKVSIPMLNKVESLNAAVSASIIMYEITNKQK